MSQIRVLLVDDEEELVSALVQRLGYRDIEASYALTGPQALKMIDDGDYDVVVLDLKLPGMSGMEVLNVLKKDRPGLPVLLITGHGAPVGLDDEQTVEDFGCLEKPVGFKVLVEKIREAAGRK